MVAHEVPPIPTNDRHKESPLRKGVASYGHLYTLFKTCLELLSLRPTHFVRLCALRGPFRATTRLSNSIQAWLIDTRRERTRMMSHRLSRTRRVLNPSRRILNDSRCRTTNMQPRDLIVALRPPPGIAKRHLTAAISHEDATNAQHRDHIEEVLPRCATASSGYISTSNNALSVELPSSVASTNSALSACDLLLSHSTSRPLVTSRIIRDTICP
jgi:hypothetical protein